MYNSSVNNSKRSHNLVKIPCLSFSMDSSVSLHKNETVVIVPLSGSEEDIAMHGTLGLHAAEN